MSRTQAAVAASESRHPFKDPRVVFSPAPELRVAVVGPGGVVEEVDGTQRAGGGALLY